MDGRLAAAALLLSTISLGPAVAEGQGLGDAAARERERRDQKGPAPAKVFTNDDLSDESEAAPSEEGGEAAAASTTGIEGAGRDPDRERLDRDREERALQEREWRARFAEARASVREAEARCWRDVVRTEYQRGIPVQMKVKEFVETEEFRQAKAALADLEEEFRRTGLPPGWARE